jgi:hypothetical protein
METDETYDRAAEHDVGRKRGNTIMGLRAEDIAKTLIDIQCEIYERHGEVGAPTDRAEYEQWVTEATDMVTQLYGNVDLARYGIELGRACQMATDMNAHISAEALERSLRSSDDDESPDDEDDIEMLDDMIDEIRNLEDDYRDLSHAIASQVQHVVDVAGDIARRSSPMTADKHVSLVTSDRFVVRGTAGMRVPEANEFRSTREASLGYSPSFVIRHSLKADIDVVSVAWADDAQSQALAECSRELLTMSDAQLRQVLG